MTGKTGLRPVPMREQTFRIILAKRARLLKELASGDCRMRNPRAGIPDWFVEGRLPCRICGADIVPGDSYATGGPRGGRSSMASFRPYYHKRCWRRI